MGGTQETDGDKNDNPFGETCPALGKMYAGQPPEQDRYRTGGRQIAPEVKLAQTTSWKEHWSEAADLRISGKSKVKRGDQSGSALQVVDGRLKGCRPLPLTRELYLDTRRRAIQTSQTLTRGGSTDRNWLRMEIKSEDREREEPETEERKGEMADAILPGAPASASATVSRPDEGGILGADHTDAGELENRSRSHGKDADYTGCV